MRNKRPPNFNGERPIFEAKKLDEEKPKNYFSQVKNGPKTIKKGCFWLFLGTFRAFLFHMKHIPIRLLFHVKHMFFGRFLGLQRCFSWILCFIWFLRFCCWFFGLKMLNFCGFLDKLVSFGHIPAYFWGVFSANSFVKHFWPTFPLTLLCFLHVLAIVIDQFYFLNFCWALCSFLLFYFSFLWGFIRLFSHRFWQDLSRIWRFCLAHFNLLLNAKLQNIVKCFT